MLFDELDKYGYATCRRIYGNWSKPNGWSREVLLKYSIIPVQQFAYTSGKNATDVTMVIDAMDLLYKDTVDAFCLVTSDSDFTRLAARLREERKFVLGMGESKTPAALTCACNKFIYLNLIGDQDKEEAVQEAEKAASVRLSPEKKEEEENSVTALEKIEFTILSILNSSEKKQIELGELGKRLSNKYPDFDVRNYGYSKLSTFIKEEMKSVTVHLDGRSNMVGKESVLSQEHIEAEIVQVLKKHHGKVENLSVIYNYLKKKYPQFDVKDYGFSRVSSFLRSLNSLKVDSNQVSLKRK